MLVPKLVHKMHDLGIPCCAITDRGNLFGGKCFSKYASDEGIKPILGSELCVHNEDSENLALSKGKELPPDRIILLVKDETGYKSIMKMFRRYYLDNMEHSDTPQYLPLSSRRRTEALASAEQLGLLARHIETTLLDLAHELRGGSITADPYFRSGQDTACTHCDYLTVCHFTPGAGGDCHRVLTKLPADKVWRNLKGGAPDA